MNDLLDCTKCRQTKLPTEMSVDKRRRGGLSSWCKDCRKVSSRTWAKNNPEKVQLRQELRPPKPYAKARNYLLKHRYGLLQDDYSKMLAQQNGACAICLRSKDYDLYVDHCHTTNKVRGLLCASCNSILGKVNDDVDTLNRAIQYLNK